VPVIRSRAWVAAPVDEVFAFFDDPANLARLMPPPVRIRLVSVEPSPPRPGTILEFRYGLGPVQSSWTVRIRERAVNERIVDETLSGPMRRFHHTHEFRAARRGGTWVEDRIDFHVGPDGPIGVVADAVAGVLMRATFIWRHVMQRRVLR
jgi:ligand-binding SRPBCC domain-containing protein